VENKEWLCISVLAVAGVMAAVYIVKIVADIKEGRRHKKLEKQWDKNKEVRKNEKRK